LTSALEDVYPLVHVAKVERVVKARHHVLSNFSYFEHFAQLDCVASDEVKKRQAIEILGHLSSLLNNLMVALSKGFDSQLVPALVSKLLKRLVLAQLVDGFHCNFNVAARQCEAKASLEIPHKMKGHL
jgi:hypothetical protein